MNGLALCAGAGGLELGLRLAHPEHRTVCFVERESYAAATLVARMEDASLDPAPVWDDLATFDGRPWRGLVDIVSAGFPCQPFSAAGKRLGTEDARWLWPEVARVVREVRPSLVFLENVPGLAAHGLGAVLGDLARSGFDAEWDCFTAAARRTSRRLSNAERERSQVGAPHERERLFILALRIKRERQRQQHAIEGPSIARAGDEAALADPEGEQVGTTRLARTSADVALTESRGRRERGQSSGCGGQLDGCDEAVADANTRGWRPRERLVLPSEQAGESDPCGTRGELAYADTTRPGSQRGQVGGSSERHEALGTFPPTPGDLERWARVLALVPEIEPPFCRVADGMASRLDRLRVIGNGVVPLVAAHAFRTLAARLIS